MISFQIQSPHLNDFRDALYVFGKFRCGVGPLKKKRWTSFN